MPKGLKAGSGSKLTGRSTNAIPPAELSGTLTGAHASVAAEAYTPKKCKWQRFFDKIRDQLLTK